MVKTIQQLKKEVNIMAQYNFGGGLSGELNKVNFRNAQKWETGKAVSMPKKIDRDYVNFLSAVKSVTVKGAKVSKSSLTWKLPAVSKLFVIQDPKTKFWSAVDVMPKKK